MLSIWRKFMSITNDDLNAFHEFALATLANRGAESRQELIDIWDTQHPAPQRHSADVAAIRAAVRDMQSGDTGRPAENVVEELRKDFASRRTQ
jgi:hypothetical protein